MSKFKRLLHLRNLIIFFVIACVFIISLIPVAVALNDSQGYRSYSGTPRSIDSVTTKPYSAANRECKVVVNNTGKDIFIPVNSESEWVLFKNAASGLGLTLNPCPGCGDGSCNNGEDCYSCSSDCGACYCNFVSDCPGYPGDITVSYTCDNSIGYCIDAYPWVECIPIPPELEGTCSFNQCWHSDQTGTCTKHLTPVW